MAHNTVEFRMMDMVGPDMFWSITGLLSPICRGKNGFSLLCPFSEGLL